jgi:Fe-S-cluster containining protein
MSKIEIGLERQQREIAKSDMEEFYRLNPDHPCKPGNAQCCHDTTFPISEIEADRITLSVSKLPKTKRKQILNRARNVNYGKSDTCPLLENGRCMVYNDRPVICIRSGATASLPREQHARLVTEDAIPLKDTVPNMCTNCRDDLEERGTTIPKENILNDRRFSEWAIPRFYSTVTDAILIKFDGKTSKPYQELISDLLSAARKKMNQ